MFKINKHCKFWNKLKNVYKNNNIEANQNIIPEITKEESNTIKKYTVKMMNSMFSSTKNAVNYTTKNIHNIIPDAQTITNIANKIPSESIKNVINAPINKLKKSYSRKIYSLSTFAGILNGFAFYAMTEIDLPQMKFYGMCMLFGTVCTVYVINKLCNGIYLLTLGTFMVSKFRVYMTMFLVTVLTVLLLESNQIDYKKYILYLYDKILKKYE